MSDAELHAATRLLHFDEHGDDVGHWVSLSKFWGAVSSSLGGWRSEIKDGPIGAWERRRKEAVIGALNEFGAFADICLINGESSGWQLFPMPHLACFSIPDLARGTIPFGNFLLGQTGPIETVEGWKVYIDGDIADEAFAKLTESIDLTPRVPPGCKFPTTAEVEQAYVCYYVERMINFAIRRPNVSARVEWIQENLKQTRDRARNIESKNRPQEWSQTN